MSFSAILPRAACSRRPGDFDAQRPAPVRRGEVPGQPGQHVDPAVRRLHLGRDRFYLHGFSAIDTPASLRVATMLFNDVGIGYFVLKSTDPQDWLTAIAPTFEVHVNSPLTHGDWTNRNDPGGVPNVVNLTYGINFEFNRRSILTFGMVTPVTGPRPFDYEVLALLNVFYGRTAEPCKAILRSSADDLV